ncbi:MAG: GNAT family N-acetyltransferase [Aridibacter famidurans]|nr:GNAT family N-acetyltransferase [Aridibacter famidurans]
MDSIKIRRFRMEDWPEVWRILEPVFKAGETYTFPTDLDSSSAFDRWVTYPLRTFVAEDGEGKILGTYFIKPNQEGGGSHVCNCGYVTSVNARGKGVASEMCVHSQVTAIEEGFKAMQYNFVVSTNEGAVRLWQKHGFEIVGTLPKAFEHPSKGLVDAYVMYKWLGKG